MLSPSATDAFKAGYAAFAEKKTFSDNPYTDGTFAWLDWRNGLVEARCDWEAAE
jgi:hypothetical protein